MPPPLKEPVMLGWVLTVLKPPVPIPPLAWPPPPNKAAEIHTQVKCDKGLLKHLLKNNQVSINPTKHSTMDNISDYDGQPPDIGY